MGSRLRVRDEDCPEESVEGRRHCVAITLEVLAATGGVLELRAVFGIFGKARLSLRSLGTVEDGIVVVSLGSRAGSIVSFGTCATSTDVNIWKHRVVSSDPFQYVCFSVLIFGYFFYVFVLVFEISHQFTHMQGVG